MKHSNRRSKLLLVILRVALALALLHVPDIQYAEGSVGSSPMLQIHGTIEQTLQTEFRLAIEQGIESNRWILPDNISPDIQRIDIVEPWGVAFVYMSDSVSGVQLQSAPYLIPGLRMSDSWQVSFPTETDYDFFIRRLPDSLLPPTFLTPLSQPDGLARAVDARNAGKLPWACNTWKTVIQDRQNPSNSHRPGGSDEWAWDFGLGSGNAIHASRSGIVAHIYVGSATNSGCRGCDWTRANRVVIDHRDGTASLYMHLNSQQPPVREGDTVSAGQLIGYADNTGNSGGNHLHFAIQPWNSSWNGKVSGTLWYQHSLESLFDDPNVSGGNPKWPQSYKSGNCGGGTIPTSTPTPTARPNSSPNKPSLREPNDWYVSRDGRSPSLCWNNNGDPDGDRVQFYAEVFDSARNAHSNWQDSTCWRPGELDGNYFNYQWRVKAKDSRGAESGWSDVRHFTIEAPNQPPTIDFKTANGNGDGRITTREQNWTFRGTAGDPENKFSRVEFRCNDCDNRGSGPDSTTSTNWAITRNGMSGRNTVYFEAFDDKQGKKSDKTLELNIDLAAPTTEAQITGAAPYGWFTEAAQVKLNARDNGTGRAVADVKEIHFWRDDGGEQVQPGATVNFSEGGDGEHTVRFYAVDTVGNVESERSHTYRVDRTPPTAIGGVSETSGVANDAWQKTQNKPTFRWNASSDATSGLGGYQFNFGQDANGAAVHKDVAAGETLEWTPNSAGVATGVYYLRGRTWDKAGNASPWQTLFTFRYDGTPPPNPDAATHLDGPKNDTWQKITARPNFTWTLPGDEGSGVKGYLAYWGTDANGESSSFLSANSFASATPLCAEGAACTGYLRLRSQDNVDWQAEEWSTTFVLRYDGAPPVADFTVNGGVTQTAQTLVTLNLNATDQGSGLREMRFSADGQGWSAWEAYAESRVWQIPDISRQHWPIYAQVKDAVGWESVVVSRTVYLDVNVDRPRSASYRLFDWADVTGAGSHTSQPSGYQAHSTVGQVVDSPPVASANYLLIGGYEAGSRAIPLVVPGHDEFEFINGIFASGVVNDTLRSAQYRLVGVWGEPALPNNEPEIASAAYRHQPGFLAARPSAKDAGTPTPTPTPGPTPTPTPTPDCDFPRVSIDNGAVFTRDTAVTLSLCAPRVTEMQVSNDGGFGGALWEPYARSKAWAITGHSNYVLPRFVYAAFKDAAGQIYSTYLDDIILDPNPPEAQVRVGTSLPLDETLLAAARSGRESANVFQGQGAAYLWTVDGQPLAEPLPLLAASADGTVDLYLSARDAVGNVTQMQVSDTGSFGGGWESYSALKTYTPSTGDGVKTVYARFQDEAGNVSQPVTATFALDTLPPVGGIALSHPILGPDVVTTTVWLGAEDNLSGVAAMRLSTDPAFADAVWRPFASTLTWVYAQADRNADALHVQFRDAAGNGSEVYAAPLLVDSTPPLVYVEVEAGESLTQTLLLFSYDDLSYPNRMRLTNDPLFLDGVVTQPYSDYPLSWRFDERKVAWVEVQDGVGNWSEPYPAYAEMPTGPTLQNPLYLPEIQSAAPTNTLEWQVYLPALGQ